MKLIKHIFYLANRLAKKIRIQLWILAHSKSGNVHLGAKTAKRVKIPFSRNEVWMRPTVSDSGRVNEYLSNIYYKKSYLHEALKKANPTILIDIGANIGLSSLSLIEEFTSIKKVIAIEAEDENYGVLDLNFNLWEKKFYNVEFVAMNAVATHSSELKMAKIDSLASLTGKNSASGTFRFGSNDKEVSSDSEI